MNHFGIAFGVITAVAIGGAVVLDRTTASHEIKVKPAPVAATPRPDATVASTSVDTSPPTMLADAGKETMSAPAPVKQAKPVKELAPTPPASAKVSRKAPASSSAAPAPIESTPLPSAAAPTPPEAPTPPAEEPAPVASTPPSTAQTQEGNTTTQ